MNRQSPSNQPGMYCPQEPVRCYQMPLVMVTNGHDDAIVTNGHQVWTTSMLTILMSLYGLSCLQKTPGHLSAIRLPSDPHQSELKGSLQWRPQQAPSATTIGIS